LPIWVTRNLDPEIILTIEERDDAADKALADWDAKHAGNDKKRGVTRYVMPRGSDGLPLRYGGVTRQQFKQAAIQEEQDRAEGIEIERDRPEAGYDPAEYGDGLTNPA